jgi:2-polyprenyl-3-methyl-5-hydroxy-6-metoxy-1,4-benzoquinol methylase
VKLQELERHWNEFGRTDPMWAILTDGTKAGNRWDADEFFAVGRQSVATLMTRSAELGLPRKQERALDFGCGLGRLTQALAEHFAAVDGVDIADSMITGARFHNQHGDRVAYHVNTCGDLSLFDDDSFDLVCSYLVLQHIHPLHSLKFVLEFVRVVRPGGLVAIQLPSRELPPPHLPPGGYRAEIVPVCAHLTAAAGERVALRAAVRNASPTSWPVQTGGRRLCIRLGNHWFAESGLPIALDDGRVVLPRDLEPGESAELELTVTAPAAPGRYALELDLVQESVCWFAQRGSPTARLVVDVEPALQASPEPTQGKADDAFVPRMEMHKVPEPLVTGLLEAAGARVVGVDRTDGGGLESCTYFATK